MASQKSIFPEITLGQILERVNKPVEVQPDASYRQIGIRSHGKGLFDKEAVSGTELGNKRVFWVEPNCFIVNIVFAWEQAVGRTTDIDKGKIASHRFPMYRPKEGKCDIDFLTYLFKTEYGKDLLTLASPGGAGRNKTLGQNEFLKIAVKIPSTPEQTRIVEILSTWDKAINTFEQLISNAQNQKKALMSDLLTGKKRISGFSKSPAECHPLSFIIEKIVGGGTPSRSMQEYWNGAIPWITVKDLKSNILNDSEEHISELGLRNSAATLIGAGTVILVTRMAVGKTAIISRPAAINQDLKAIIPNSRTTNSFLYWTLLFNEENFLKLGTGSTVKGIRIETIKNLRIWLPESIKEQNAIVKALDAAQRLESNLVSQLQIIRREKASLMQQLLTGKRRIKIGKERAA